jgi:hypothetical protein
VPAVIHAKSATSNPSWIARKRAYRRAGGQRFSMNFIFVLYVVYIKYDYPREG